MVLFCLLCLKTKVHLKIPEIDFFFISFFTIVGEVLRCDLATVLQQNNTLICRLNHFNFSDKLSVKKRHVRRKKMMTTSLVVYLSVSLFIPQAKAEKRENAQPDLEYRVIKITVNGKPFKDLNGNGKLDPYENWSISDEVRVKDLVSKMTLEEKAGMLIIPEFPKFTNGKLVLPNKMINQSTRYFIFRETPSADVIANYNNQLQYAAESTRLGIPVVIISNPRNHAESLTTLGEVDMDKPGQFSYWPAPLGLAATRDLNLIAEFAQIASKEYRATGIRKLFFTQQKAVC